MSSAKKIRALAVVLPQFHPIKENDEWWGKGFTEWRNVVQAKPRFKGHYQPHLPADLGFYDLRLDKSREAQAQMAKDHDIFGFVYFHYWFNGKRLLETPLDRILSERKPDFPFMLCWANENWTRRWDGADQEVLIEQEYSEEDHRNHVKYLCLNVFKDERYIKIKGKPFFLFFNTHIIPNLIESIAIWRDEAKKHGFEDIYLGGVCTAEGNLSEETIKHFDVTVEWQPDWGNLIIRPTFIEKIKNKVFGPEKFRKISYNKVVDRMLAKKKVSHKHYQCVMPGWDNAARRKHNAFIIDNSTPEKYGEWLKSTCENLEIYSNEENFLFLNAWNEWAEGNHLEPDQKWGKAYLNVTKKILNRYL